MCNIICKHWTAPLASAQHFTSLSFSSQMKTSPFLITSSGNNWRSRAEHAPSPFLVQVSPVRKMCEIENVFRSSYLSQT